MKTRKHGAHRPISLWVCGLVDCQRRVGPGQSHGRSTKPLYSRSCICVVDEGLLQNSSLTEQKEENNAFSLWHQGGYQVLIPAPHWQKERGSKSDSTLSIHMSRLSSGAEARPSRVSRALITALWAWVYVCAWVGLELKAAAAVCWRSAVNW